MGRNIENAIYKLLSIGISSTSVRLVGLVVRHQRSVLHFGLNTLVGQVVFELVTVFGDDGVPVTGMINFGRAFDRLNEIIKFFMVHLSYGLSFLNCFFKIFHSNEKKAGLNGVN